VKKCIWLILTIALFANIANATCTGKSPIWTTTPDYESVSSCVSGASSGDTINVADGDATWSSQIAITKGMTLKGGTGTITFSYAGYAIWFQPSNPATDNLEISGFTFTQAASSSARLLKIYNTSTTTAIAQIKVYNNTITQTSGGSAIIISVSGAPVYGVFYNNTFNAIKSNTFDLNGDDGWESWVSEYGSANNLYIEDNTFNYSGNGYGPVYSGHGFKGYVFRYNTVTQQGSQFLDMHGSYSGWCGTMSAEAYGNKIITTQGPYIMYQRGGQALVFYNAISTNVDFSPYVIDESYGQSTCSHPSNPQPTAPSNSYYFNQRRAINGALSTATAGNYVTENTNFWVMRSGTFDGTGTSDKGGGVGCGTNRPATCTTGVAYWATDQSCTDLTGMVGASPSTPISGTLYKCNASGEWKPYYTPYTYPHPLRGTITISGGISISGGSIQ
jgi:hypothetical protein